MKNHELESKMAAEAGSLLWRHQSSVRRMIAGLALASGLTAGSWALGIPPVAWTQTFASAATKSKPTKASQDSKADDQKADKTANSETEETTVKLNYYSASWPRVFQDIAATGDLEIIADKVPRGRFSRMDKSEHTRKEALRIVNKELEQQGLRLIQKGQFLILIETTLTRPNYPPAVLPARTQPKPLPEEQDENASSTGFRAESITKPRAAAVDRAVYSEDVADKSIHYSGNKHRQPEAEAPRERTQSARNSAPPRSVRQTAHEEPGEASPAATSRKPHPIESAIPTMLADVGAPAPAVVYRARQLSAVELSKRVYRALKSSAELVDTGRNGLPAVSIVAPQFKSADSPNGKAVAARSVEFMISIDEKRNELLIDGTDKDTSAAMKLLRVIDRIDDPSVKTQIKPSTKYACEIADQLPAEIERIRAARGSDALARRPVEDKPAWLADQRQRRDVRGLDPDAEPPLPAEQSQIADGVLGNVLGSFRGEVSIEVIDDLNAIIVTGNERDVEQIIKIIKQIEMLSEATAPQVHLLHLKNVDSESLAELLTSVYEKLTKFPGKATQPRQNVAIIPVTKPNSLLIVAPLADLESILDLADELDKPVDPQTEFQVFQLKFAIATDVETLITEFYKERKSLGAKALIIADPRSNSVIVRAQARDLDEIKALINKVDRDNVGSTNQVRIFRLKNAVATELAAVINAAIQSVLSPPTSGGGGGGGGGGQGQQGLGGGQVDEQFKGAKSTVLKFLTVEKGESRQLKSGILSDIRITPDSHANSLIVTASDKSMDLIAALVQTLDRPTNTVSEIKVFTLENADANQMVVQLNSLFNNQQQGGQGGQLRQQLGIAFANADDASSSLVPLKFSVDTRTNSVIAVGSADALRVVEAILLRLDESNLRSRKNMVVRLNNAPAALIATAVTQFFQQQRDLTQVDPNLVSSVEQLEREVIVIPDTVSNNLLVSSTPRYFPDILAMIKKLDARPRQVVIQALIVEVQLNNIDEFGIELGLQSPILFDRSLKQPPVVLTSTNTTGQLQTTTQTILSIEGTPGFNFNNPGVPLGNNVNSTGDTTSQPGTVGGQALSNFSLGRSNAQLGYGGLVLSAGSNSVNALLRALSARTKIQILSRPQIRALDSQLAEVFVGQTIPTVTSFQTNATTGVISPTLTQRDTGIGMQVTPRINQDGDIVIQMYAFRSQLSQQTVNVTTDSRGQPVGQRITDLSNVRSTVLVPANSTIVIGGMISTRDETTVRKAPFLGDLPLVGQLFRYDSRSALRSELLIFLTPRIVDGPEEEECLKEIEMSRIHFIESEAEEIHGPLRAVAPEQLFEEGPAPWINQGVPPSPIMTPLDLPSPTSSPGTSPPGTLLPPTPTKLPPSPPTEATPNIPPSPPLPDPNLTRINALRAMATEQDDAAGDGVSTANWTSQPASKKPSATKKRLFDSAK